MAGGVTYALYPLGVCICRHPKYFCTADWYKGEVRAAPSARRRLCRVKRPALPLQFVVSRLRCAVRSRLAPSAPQGGQQEIKKQGSWLWG